MQHLSMDAALKGTVADDAAAGHCHEVMQFHRRKRVAVVRVCGVRKDVILPP